MLLEALLALTTVLPRLGDGVEAARARAAAIEWPASPGDPGVRMLPYFSTTARAVSNWRDETAIALMPTSLALVAKYAAGDPAFVARCVKLNNYWCIKQARWSGELGGDADGHTGFATAADGADAAALLLRRYYREYNRRSALAIVRRWAPAECGAAMRSAPSPRSAPRMASSVAPLGLGGTLRARFLAHHARGGAPRRVAVHRGGGGNLRVQPWSALARLGGRSRVATRQAPPLPALKPVGDIASGIGASARPEAAPQVVRRTVAASPPSPKPTVYRAPLSAKAAGASDPAALLASDRFVVEAASLPSIVAGLPGNSLLDLRVPAPFCGSDETRIRNYASRIAASVGLKPDDDLRLFETDGTPTERLALVMLAMSSVELGSLHATPALVAGAVARLALRTQPASVSAAAN